MGTLTDRIRRLGRQSAVPSEDGAVVGQIDEREQAIIDRHTSEVPSGSLFQKVARGRAEIEIDARRQQRAYAEQAPLETAEPVVEMLSNLGDRGRTLGALRQMTPEQRQEALKLAPGVAQQLGDDRGGFFGRIGGAVSRGISHGVSQPAAELAGQLTGTDWGGTDEEIAYIRQLDAAASQEFAPARPGDPWYQSGPLQAVEMAPWMATVVGGAGLGRAVATGAAKPLAAQMATRAGMGRATLAAAGKAGELTGIAAASLPPQYAQEVDQLKEIGMQDGTQLRLLAGSTALVSGLLEGIVPNPFKTGKVPLTEGAVTAARQYLWEAAKQAPGEMSEEYLQGVTSGLGKTVAGYLDANAEDKSIADAFKTGWDQAKEAALPMAFLLGVPAIGGAGMSAAQASRLTRLQEIRAKGFVSAEDAQKEGIEGKNRKERLANTDRQIEELKQPPIEPPVPPPLPQGTTDASQVPTNETRDDFQGDGREGSQVDSGSQVHQTIEKPFQGGEATQVPLDLESADFSGVVDRLSGDAQSLSDIWDTNSRPNQFRGSVSVPSKGNSGRSVLPLTDAGLFETTPDGVVAARKFLSDLSSRHSSLKELLDSLSGDRKELVQSSVLAAIRDEEVFRSVVTAIPVDVMNNLVGAEGSTQELLDNPSMLLDALIVPPDGPVGPLVGRIIDTLDAFVRRRPSSGRLPVAGGGAIDSGFAGERGNIPAADRTGDVHNQERNTSQQNGQGVEAEVAKPPVTPAPQQTEAVDPERDQAEDELAGLLGDEPAPSKPTEPQPVKPIPPKTADARQEFIDKAKPGAEFESKVKGYEGRLKVRDDGTIQNASGRVMGDVQDMANRVKPKDTITWTKEATTETPNPAAPAANPDVTSQIIDVGQELSGGVYNTRIRLADLRSRMPNVPREEVDRALMGLERNGSVSIMPFDDPRETRDDDKAAALPNSLGNPRHIIYIKRPKETAEKPKPPVAAPPLATQKPEPESKWSSETRVKLEAVPALKGAKVEPDEKTGTVRVTRPDGLTARIHFNSDEELAAAAKEKGRNPESIYGWYIKKPGDTEARIYVRSDANHTNILNHEIMHWLEFTGVVTKEEVEKYGGREAIAEKYGKWAELKQRKKDSVFQRIYDALEPLFSSQRRFFEEVGARQAQKPRLSAMEQARENLRKRGKQKPSQSDIDAETAAVIREREADNKVRQEFKADRDAQKAQDDRRKFVGEQKALANPATVDSLGFGDIAQVNDDIERGRVSYEDAINVADAFVEAGYLPQLRRDQIRKPQEDLSKDKKPSVPQSIGEQDTGTSRGQTGEQVGNKPTEKAPVPQQPKEGPTTTAEQPAEDAASTSKLPWLNSSPDQETNWYGTKISVAPANRREEPYTGQVVRVLNGGDMVEVQPDGQDGTFRVDSSRITLAEKSTQVADKPLVEPASKPLPEPAIPAFTRTTPDKGSTTRQFQSERVEKAKAEISDLERKARAKRGEHDGLRSNATKKRAAVRKDIEFLNRRIHVVQGEIASDFASDTLAKLEDELESPRSYDHYLAGMKAIHKLKAGVAEDASRRGEMGREAARAVVAKEEKEADRLDAELQGRAKDIAKSMGFTSGDAEQIALAASNGFTVFEDRSLADVVEVQGKRTRESRVSQEINKLKPESSYGRKDLSDEQIEEFTKQYQEASLDDKNWLAKRGEVDKAVKNAINASREAVRKREDEERKAKEAERAKDEQEALANARERAKKYFLDERISNALKKQKPKTKPVKVRLESPGGPVKIVDGKTIDGDQNGELYPNGLILHKTFEEDSNDFGLTHARSGLAFPFGAKKSAIQELIGLLDLLVVDFNVDTDANGQLPSELISRVKQINTAWDNNDYSMLSEQDYATVQALAEVAKTDIDADLMLTADDLGANGIPPGLGNVMTDSGLLVVKEMVEAVPEFAYDPVFTVKDGKLLYRDGYEFKLEPTAFNLHPSELKEGQTVGINLEDLGIKRSTPQDVVAEMMKQAGIPRVTKAKGGDVSVGYVGAKPTSLQQGKSDNEWNVVGGTPKVQEMAVSVLKRIRWRQPGQDGDPKTDIDVVQEDKPQATDAATVDSTDRMQEIDKELEQLQSQYEKKMAAQSKSSMVPPSIKGDALSQITKKMDKLDAEKKSLQATDSQVEVQPFKRGDIVSAFGRDEAKVLIPDLGDLSFKKGNVRIEMTSGNSKGKTMDVEPSDIRPLAEEDTIAGKAAKEARDKAAAKQAEDEKRYSDMRDELLPLVRRIKKSGVILNPKTKKAKKELLDKVMMGTQNRNEKMIQEAIDIVAAEVATSSEPAIETPPPAPAQEKQQETPASVPVEAEFIELKGQDAPGVKQTIRVIAGGRTLLMERGKHDGEWSIKEPDEYTGEVKGKTPVKTKGEVLASGIVETKKAKEIAQRIIDGTFDKDYDKRFVREDTQNIGLTNAGLAEAMKDQLQRRDSFAKLLREDSLFTDGRLMMKVNEKDRDAILKAVGETFEGRPLSAVAKMMDDGQKALSRSSNAMKPIGYRGGYLDARTAVLQSQDGDATIVDKALHDTILKKYPDAVPYFLDKSSPISYASNGDVVAIAMPMKMDKSDAKLKDLVDGKYDFEAEAAEAAKFPPPQSKTKLKKAAERANQELADAVDEFGNVIKGKLGANLPLNPEVIAAAAKVVAKALEAGVRNFAELMERMVTKYGVPMAERMRGVLQQEWDKQVNAYPVADEDGNPPETPQPHPELVQPEPIPLTSVKNAIVDELRIQRGETPMPEVTPQTVQQWLDAAGNRIASDPYAGNTLVEQLLTGDKTSVDEMEGMVLQYHYRAVNNLFEAADTKLTEAKSNGDPAAIAIAQDEARVIMRRLTAVETALDKAGTAWGRAGVSRQIFLKQDFSLASMVRRARVANAGNELSDEQVEKISEQAKQIEELQKRIAELEAKTVEQEQSKAIDEAIKKDIEETKKPPAVKPKSKVRLKAEERVASAWEQFGAAMGKLYSNPYDPALIKPALEVVKAYVDLGIVTFREFMSTASQRMGAKEAKAAEPIFRTAWDQLRADGEIAQPSLDITNVGQLTRFARQVQRAMVESGITEREEVVDAVHEALQEIVPEITRRQAMDALSSYGQFSQLSKDPIDQIIRDINGQLQQLAKLEDMEKGQAPAKTGVERRSPTDEERRLTQLVNEAKRRGGFVVTDPETQLKSAMAAAKTAVKNRIADMNFEIQAGSRIVRGKTELIPDAELEQLRKERDELQKVHKEMFPPKGATQAQKIASANRALDAAIASLEAKLAVGDISPAPQPTPLSTPEIDAKRARLKALNDQRDALRKIANPNMTAEQIKIRSLDKSIEELEKQLATGNFSPKPKPTPLTSPEINARQAKLEELRATKKAILAAANPKMTPEQRASRAYEAHLRKQLAIYLEKIAQGDFAPTPKKPPRVLSQGELALKKQLADVKHDFFEALSKYHLANLSPGGRAIDIVLESAHLSRAIMTSIDLSAVLRQGGLGVYSHPAMARKAAAEMWSAIWSREKEFQSVEKLRTRPNAQLYEESGLNITDSEGKLTRQEEAFMGRWARTGVDFAGSRVQAASKLALEPVAASARAYVTFINNLRADLFDVMVENLGPGGQVTKEEAKLIATYVNVATGRSDLKKLNDWAATMNTVFFAPRYVTSRFQYLAMPFYLLGSKDSGRVKKLIAIEYARTFTGAAVFIGSLTALAYLAAGGDDEEKPSVEFNPLSADFGKVRIDETRLDPLAGLAQVIVFSSRMLAWHTKGSVTGKIKPFYEGGPYETTHGSEAWRFLRTKFAPIPGAVVTAFSGMKNVVGEKVTPVGLVGGLFVPISVGEVYATMRHRGIPKGTALAVLNSMGASVNTYGPKTAYLDATPEERAKQVKDYIKYMNWESDLPAFSQYLQPEDLKKVQARQDERRGDLVYEAMAKVLPKKEYKTEVHYEEAQERHDKINKEFEGFRKQYAPTYADALRYLGHHFDNEGGIKIQWKNEAKPSYIERKARLLKHYQTPSN